MEASSLLDYFDSLFRYALVLTRHESDAEDLVQETYVRALRRIDSIRNPDNVKSWMITILRNAWTSQQRRTKKASNEIEFDLSSIPDTEGERKYNGLSCCERSFERDLVCNVLTQLPPQLREILILREFDDLSYREIADILNCPVGTVMSRLARARLKLRNLLSAVLQPLRREP